MRLFPIPKEAYLNAMERLRFRETVAEVGETVRKWNFGWEVSTLMGHRYPMDSPYWEELERGRCRAGENRTSKLW